MSALLATHFLLAALLPTLSRRLGRGVFLLGATPLFATVVWSGWHAPTILAQQPVVESLRWAPQLGLDLALRIDAFSLLMLALVSGIGSLIFAYARWYFDEGPEVGRLAGLLLAFAGAMVGLVVADNLLALFLFWELTSITSYLLIGFDDRSAKARAAALRALLVTGGGGLAMLGGFVLLAQTTGTYTLSEILAQAPRGPLVEIALALALLGAFTKSAQAPFHFWLPGAMAAPTPVSAYLHSATMVKAGVYLVARLAPVFAEVWYWRPLVIAVGLATMLVGGWRAVAQRDLKLLLAHGTTSQLGFMTVLFGAGYPAATLAGAALLLAHGLFKATLFMVVGIVDHQAGTRDLSRLNGLRDSLRLVFVIAIIAAASMAGLPPLAGFIAKEAAFSAFAALAGDPPGVVVVGTLVAGSALTLAYSVRFVWGAFARKHASDLDIEHAVSSAERPPVGFLAPAVVLAILSVVSGLVPGLMSDMVVSGAQALDAAVPDHPLTLWHGFNTALALSAVSITTGFLLWWQRRQVAAFQRRVHLPVDGAALHDRGVRGLVHVADVLTGRLQTGSLPMYLAVILGTVVLAPGLFLVNPTDLNPELLLVDRPMQLVVAALMVIATLVALGTERRMTAVLMVSIVGYCTAFLFVIQGAPDLALTQLLIETLLLVLFVLVLRHLPATFSRRSTATWQVTRIVAVLAVGLFTATATLFAVASRRDASIAGEYLRRALPEAHGRNVVNTILVDFRAFDTFGEIVVLTVAALGVIGLVRAARKGRREEHVGHGAHQAYRPSPILDGAVSMLFHTILVASLVLLVVGHNRPGGGFIGGLVAGAAFILVYLGGGTPRVRRAESAAPELFLGSGITIAAVTGAAAWLDGGEFLHAMLATVDVPLLGPITLSSVLLFDVGVYLVVVGLVIALLHSIGHEESFSS
jgi:multicomponent Na+:H+ antiporter subunit A